MSETVTLYIASLFMVGGIATLGIAFVILARALANRTEG